MTTLLESKPITLAPSDTAKSFEPYTAMLPQPVSTHHVGRQYRARLNEPSKTQGVEIEYAHGKTYSVHACTHGPREHPQNVHMTNALSTYYLCRECLSTLSVSTSYPPWDWRKSQHRTRPTPSTLTSSYCIYTLGWHPRPDVLA